MVKGYNGWMIDPRDRGLLMQHVPPIYSRTIAHHITHQFGVSDNHPLPQDTKAYALGVADDGAGVQCILIGFDDGNVRPDGNYYHCTWSLNNDRKPVESNDVAIQYATLFNDPIAIRVTPTFFPFK